MDYFDEELEDDDDDDFDDDEDEEDDDGWGDFDDDDEDDDDNDFDEDDDDKDKDDDGEGDGYGDDIEDGYGDDEKDKSEDDDDDEEKSKEDKEDVKVKGKGEKKGKDSKISDDAAVKMATKLGLDKKIQGRCPKCGSPVFKSKSSFGDTCLKAISKIFVTGGLTTFYCVNKMCSCSYQKDHCLRCVGDKYLPKPIKMKQIFKSHN